MLRIGLDMGTAFIRLALLEDDRIVSLWEKRHRGRLLPGTLISGLNNIKYFVFRFIYANVIM